MTLQEGNRMRLTLVIAVILLCPSFAAASTWQIDSDNSRVQFAVSHLLSTVEGSFRKFSGVVELNDQEITRSRLSVIIDAASVSTGTKALDEELCSDRFLNVRRYPTITFVARNITRSGVNTLKVSGDLKIHGVTREVVLDVKGPSVPARDRYGKMRRSASAVTRISRKAFGLDWSSMMATGVGDDIDISLAIELVGK